VLCPSVWPRHDGRAEDGRNLVLPGFQGYLGTFNDGGFLTGDAGHLLLGGQPKPFSLTGAPGALWPRPGQPNPNAAMRLPPDAFPAGHLPRATIARRAEVGGLPAIVIHPREYPRGGVHGGHVVVLWNQRGRGYLVSLHFGGRPESSDEPVTVPKRFRYTLSDRIHAALRIATSAAHG
jgi:hypothetical protein